MILKKNYNDKQNNQAKVIDFVLRSFRISFFGFKYQTKSANEKNKTNKKLVRNLRNYKRNAITSNTITYYYKIILEPPSDLKILKDCENQKKRRAHLIMTKNIII